MNLPLQKSRIPFLKIAVAVVGAALGIAVAYADLKPWKDYQESDAVWWVTTVKVDANMGDAYLEGLRKTWVTGNEVSKKLGQIEDYRIYRSMLPSSGDFNLMLVVKFKNAADLGPSRARYEAFMKEYGDARNKEITEFSQKNYPAMRKITGDYFMHEITLH